jgi:hypothetical protein
MKVLIENYEIRPCYVKGDLSTERVIVGTKVCKTITEGKNYIKAQTGKAPEKWGDKYRGVKFNGKHWVEENTGEERDGYNEYVLQKI